ncbi:TPA: HNH endonuclease [Klebsiella pneumoniae]|uniref:HNH endonuclease n=2 Tax=Enterobacterales TaxID=91347 RepID=UPI001F47C0DB|nr:HNH endonuclease [Klebsiella pneumoniae]MCE7394748.1 HNH endonuclease [Klebsiella pneumoniae]HBR1807418.1 HNH endonuclease [Klebsiella pneumoniae]HBT0102685.1 HNH endonuclease [Klebsiella pneumoniae]HBV2561904.1 HNH endonuclease [Klebsiella pneumoniae]HCA8357540.1 HNH endonuclease [Klebsiella pneumoniae]
MSHENKALAAAYLKECVNYNPETGLFTWLNRPLEHFKSLRACNAWNSRYSGLVAGSIRKDGYCALKIDGNGYKAHRIAWLIAHNEWPDDMDIDHINGIRNDNRLSNLRLANRNENCANVKVRVNCSSGFFGVHWFKSREEWVAQIRTGKVKKHLGYFHGIGDAVRAYNAECEKLHGEYGKRKIEHNLNKLRELGLQ